MKGRKNGYYYLDFNDYWWSSGNSLHSIFGTCDASYFFVEGISQGKISHCIM